MTEGEFIEVQELSVAQIKDILFGQQEVLNVPPGFLWGVSWFFLNIVPSLST